MFTLRHKMAQTPFSSNWGETVPAISSAQDKINKNATGHDNESLWRL